MAVPFPSRIYLIGFMGSGKTTLGRALSALTGGTFIDTDEEIETRSGKTIQQIFTDEGEEHFRRLEKETVKNLADLGGNNVIALGGGAVCTPEILDVILSTGFVVYLQVPAPVLVSRLTAEKSNRPLISNLPDHELLPFIEKKLKEREVYYEKAHLMVSGINLGASSLFEIIRAAAPQDHI